MRRAGVWLRLCIVLTVAWIIGCLLTWSPDILSCSDREPWKCDYLLSRAWEPMNPFWLLGAKLGFYRLGIWGNPLFVAFAGIVAAWGLGGAAVASVRWILKGRR